MDVERGMSFFVRHREDRRGSDGTLGDARMILLLKYRRASVVERIRGAIIDDVRAGSMHARKNGIRKKADRSPTLSH